MGTDAASGGCTDACGDGIDPSMHFVGDGRGDYIQETSYKFVGNGAGQFDMGLRGRRRVIFSYCAVACAGFCCAVIFMALLFLCLPDGLNTLRGEVGDGGDQEPSRKYNCFKDYVRWQEAWPKEKKVWCCANMKVACDSAPVSEFQDEGSRTTSIRSTSRGPPSTTSGLGRFTGGPAGPNSVTSRPSPPATMPPSQAANLPGAVAASIPSEFSCAGGPGAWSIWTKEKRSFCCRDKAIGCTATPSAATQLSSPEAE